MLRVSATATVAGFVALAASTAGEAASTVRVHFLQGEQTVAVERSGETLRDAVTALIAGPSSSERQRRMATELPAGVPLLGIEVSGGVATVDLGREFQEGQDAASISARIAQLVLTVTAFPSVREVRLLVEGSEPAVAFPGYTTSAALTRADILAPPEPERATQPVLLAARTLTVWALQRKLAFLGYLPLSAVDGSFGDQTRTAVIAFQKWEDLARDGIPGPLTAAALAKARRPTPRTEGPGTRVEVLLDRQLALVIRRGRVVRTIHVSTGAANYETPPGRYAVFRKRRRSWSVPYRVWLPWASYFVRGIAFHQARNVPVTPASHGCVRVTRHDARWLYRMTPVGTKVRVLTRSLPARRAG